MLSVMAPSLPVFVTGKTQLIYGQAATSSGRFERFVPAPMPREDRLVFVGLLLTGPAVELLTPMLQNFFSSSLTVSRNKLERFYYNIFKGRLILNWPRNSS
jgi:hypothetical protein